jgi:hypothetical protein
MLLSGAPQKVPDIAHERERRDHRNSVVRIFSLEFSNK